MTNSQLTSDDKLTLKLRHLNILVNTTYSNKEDCVKYKDLAIKHLEGLVSYDRLPLSLQGIFDKWGNA